MVAGQVLNTSGNPITNTITRNQGSLDGWLNTLNTWRSQYTATVYDIPFPGGGEVPLQMVQRNLRNRVSYSYYADTGSFSLYAAATYYNYDVMGNVDTLLQDYGNSGGAQVQNMMNVNLNRFKKIAYKYDLVSGKVNMVTYQPGWSDQWIHRYTYDAENRLTLVETSTDNRVWEKDARYEYYLHGPLARMTLGDQQVQGVDYAYTLQGWLKGINSTGGTAEHDMGGDGKGGDVHQYTARDAMGLTLNYFTGDYAAINGGVQPFPGYSGVLNAYRPLFNGNISSLSVYQKKFETGAPGGPLIFYNYKYDQLNRLTGQDAYHGFRKVENDWGAMPSMGDSLKERITYDANGNILKYLRKSMEGGDMDGLSYQYYAGTNRLNYIADTVDAGTYTNSILSDIDNQSINNYTYDSIGNLVRDNAEKVNIRWNVYGKITQIDSISPGGTIIPKILYEYDALGNRIGQVVIRGTNRNYTWYVRDAQGNILSTYTAQGGTNLTALVLQQEDRYIYGSSRVGSFSMKKLVDGGPVRLLANASDTFARGYRQYELTNYLGNVLATISDKKFGISSGGSLIDHYEPEIVSATDYYPFGMPSRVSLTGKGYRFGFNGQERSDDIKGFGNSYTAEFWEYDPRIGRRWNVDPVTKENESPYATFGNNPINNVDPNGADTINLNRTTTVRHLKGSNDGHSDHLVIPGRAIVTQSGDIVINKAEGNDVFRITNTTVNIDEDGNQTSSSSTTTLELNNPQTFYRSGGHNMKGFIDDRFALAAYAPDWLLNSYDKSSGGDIGIRSAIAYQKDMKALPYITATAAVAEIIFTGGLSGWFSRAGGIGFNSFNEFKAVYGSAGKGQAWHHIVEQNPANIAKFGAQRIHNTENLIRLEHGAGSTHAKVSGYYSSKQFFTNGQTVREWLSTQSYKAQFNFGIKTMKQFGFTP